MSVRNLGWGDGGGTAYPDSKIDVVPSTQSHSQVQWSSVLAVGPGDHGEANRWMSGPSVGEGWHRRAGYLLDPHVLAGGP